MRMTKAHRTSVAQWWKRFAVVLLIMLITWAWTRSPIGAIGAELSGLGLALTSILLILDKAHSGVGRNCRLGTPTTSQVRGPHRPKM